MQITLQNQIESMPQNLFLVQWKTILIPAWYFLGKMFYNGLGVEKDIDAAIYYFEKAVKGKNLFAAYQLGKIYSSEVDNLGGYESHILVPVNKDWNEDYLESDEEGSDIEWVM